MLIPRLQSFQPDLIFISAGFDSHFDDFYHFLSEEDYHWVTEQLCAVADRVGQEEHPRGPAAVISILEGGYSLTASPLSKPEVPKRKGAAGKTTANPNLNPIAPADDPNLKFAQQTGDGGLVKG